MLNIKKIVAILNSYNNKTIQMDYSIFILYIYFVLKKNINY